MRTDTHVCSVCARAFPLDHYRVRIKVPPLAGRTYRRTEWGKLVVDTSRPCRACRANAASRDAKRRNAAAVEAEREARLASALANDLEVTPDMLPKVRIIKGCDPVLAACSAIITSTRHRVKQLTTGCRELAADREEGVAAARGAGKEHPFERWRRRLLLARIALFEDVRNRRKIDLQNPITANDPLRMHVRAYISDADIRTLDWVAEKVNYYRSGGARGRGYLGLPHINMVAPDTLATNDGSNFTRGDVVLTKAWAPYVYAIEAAKRSANAMIRRRAMHSPVRARAYTTTLDDGTSLRFAMDDYHLKRIEAAKQARRQIDRAITAGMHPTAWTCPWTGEVGSLRDWSRLVPPLLRRDMFNMWRVLPEDKQQKLRPFRMRLKQTLFQRTHRLDANNVPVSDKLALE